jgi:predicted helicase
LGRIPRRGFEENKVHEDRQPCARYFRNYSLGISTNRDEWLYGMEKLDVATKAKASIAAYDEVPRDSTVFPNTIKWSRNLKRRLKQGRREDFNPKLRQKANHRPFVPR